MSKIALVTGGTGGIGTAICLQLAGEGYRVIANHLSGENDAAIAWQKSLKDKGFDIALVAGDVSDYDSVEAMIKTAEAEVGSIDVLVNNAGITLDKTLKRMSPNDWNAVININLTGAFNCTKHVIDSMLANGFGRVINISSINGQKGQFGQTNYSAAKAGLHGFTKALAQEVASKGITVNTVSPGYIATEMVMAVAEEIRQSIIDQVPVGRLGKPEEIARAVAFLAADDAGFITGSNLSVNGGQHMF